MESGSLHLAARRHLTGRYAELTGRYAALPNDGRAWDGFRYTPDAVQLFSRYHVVDAILVEIERLDPDDLPPPDVVFAALLRAAGNARSELTEPVDRRGDAAAADERDRFASVVRGWRSAAVPPADPLPYRRVLAPAESAAQRDRLARRWGVRGRYWHPLTDEPIPPDVLILRAESMWAADGVAAVRRALTGLGRARVTELREDGPGHRLAVELLDPVYDGAEGLWSDEHLDWVGYASHEATVAFAGVVAEALPRVWPDCGDWLWTGW